MSSPEGLSTTKRGLMNGSSGGQRSQTESGRPDVLVVTPSFHEAAGGAAVYYRLLTHHLRDRGWWVEVVGDAGTTDSYYHPLFPRRCDLAGRGLHNRVRYLAQNLTYLRLPALVSRLRPEAVVIHSSFLNLPGIFPVVLKEIRKRAAGFKGKVLVDVRDQLMPTRTIKRLSAADHVIACSENVDARLRRHGLAGDRINHIPVIQEALHLDPRDVRQTLHRFGTADRSYLLSVGLVKEEKGIDILLEAYHDHLRRRLQDIQLVVCGQIKTSHPAVLRGLRGPGVRYLGPVERRDALHLAAGSALNVNVSRSEGMPRASLESIALGRPTLLPKGVPEFAFYCPDFVARSYEPSQVAAQMVELIESGLAPPYPIERHTPETVLAQYEELLRGPA